MPLDQYLSKAENIDLSGDDIHKITDGICLPIPYHELDKIDDINQLFQKSKVIMLLYEIEKENVGHWVTIIKHDDDTIEFFDPYALKPDEELKYSPYYHRTHKGIDVPHLTYLLEKSGSKIIYNKCRLQKLLKDVNTCGRHCAVRAKFSDMSLSKYCKMLLNNKCYDPDLWVTALTITYSL